MQDLPYPQVTQDQIDLWLSNPVTKAYLDCIKWYCEEVTSTLGDGSCVDSSNADLTLSHIHLAMGQQQGLESAGDYIDLLSRFKMIEEREETEEAA